MILEVNNYPGLVKKSTRTPRRRHVDFLNCSPPGYVSRPGAGLADYFDAAGVDAAALASSAFLSMCSFLACLPCLAFFSTAGLASVAGFASGADATGVAAVAAVAEAGVTFAAGAGVLATAEADAALAGAAGVCANALPIKTVEAMMAVMSLFMVLSLKMSVSDLLD